MPVERSRPRRSKSFLERFLVRGFVTRSMRAVGMAGKLKLKG